MDVSDAAVFGMFRGLRIEGRRESSVTEESDSESARLTRRDEEAPKEVLFVDVRE